MMAPQPVNIIGPVDLESRALEPHPSLGPECSDHVSRWMAPLFSYNCLGLHRQDSHPPLGSRNSTVTMALSPKLSYLMDRLAAKGLCSEQRRCSGVELILLHVWELGGGTVRSGDPEISLFTGNCLLATEPPPSTPFLTRRIVFESEPDFHEPLLVYY